MPDQHLAANLAELFRTRRFRTYTTDDVVGVEMAGALKNVYAIAVGMGYSLGIGENTRAMVMARAVREMSKLGLRPFHADHSRSRRCHQSRRNSRRCVPRARGREARPRGPRGGILKMMPPANQDSRDMPRTGEQKVLIRVKRAMGHVGDDEDA